MLVLPSVLTPLVVRRSNSPSELTKLGRQISDKARDTHSQHIPVHRAIVRTEPEPTRLIADGLAAKTAVALFIALARGARSTTGESVCRRLPVRRPLSAAPGVEPGGNSHPVRSIPHVFAVGWQLRRRHAFAIGASPADLAFIVESWAEHDFTLPDAQREHHVLGIERQLGTSCQF